MKSIATVGISLLCLHPLILGASGYSSPKGSITTRGRHEANHRRAFLSFVSCSWFPLTLPSLAVDVTVSPVAHTFITASGRPKPLRENDVTRFLTNAKVVYALEGRQSDLVMEVLRLTNKRKAEQGPGVTPGLIHLVSSCPELKELAISLGISVETIQEITPQSIATIAGRLPVGDTLFVGPRAAGSTVSDGAFVDETARALGVDVGGAKGGGVLSVLLDGPRENLALDEGGFPISTLLWYSFP